MDECWGEGGGETDREVKEEEEEGRQNTVETEKKQDGLWPHRVYL